MGKKRSKALVARGKRKLQQIAAFFRKLWRIKKVRVVCFVLAGVIVLVEVIPLISRSLQAANYELGAIKTLVDPTSKDLRQKLTYEDKSQAWVFNANAAEQLPGQSGDGIKVGGLTYSAELPKQMSRTSGLKMTDASAKIDMTMTPQFGVHEGRIQEGYAIYPIKGSDAQLVYTFKQDGVKEDIVLHRAPGDKTSFAYTLDLPDSLEARLQDDGSVGIFGGARSLFGNISYGSDKDRELVEKARKNSKKTELYYAIPAPVIKGDKDNSVKAQFKLDGKRLTVEVTGLKDAHYPLSIDPSFIMDTATNCSWRKTGNSETNASYTGCQLSRSALSGGTVGSWTTSTRTLAQSSVAHAAAIHNGYYYYIPQSSSAAFADVYYAPVGSNGDITAPFTATSSLNTPRSASSMVVYNGYIYAVGGQDGSQAFLNTIEFAKIKSDGSLGPWTNNGSTFTTARNTPGLATYNGYLYIMGGCTISIAWVCSTFTNTTAYARINADGTLGTFTSGTSLSTARATRVADAYNGYLYAVGGYNGSSSAEYAPINADGSIGSWTTASSNAGCGANDCAAGDFYNGYIYVLSGGTTIYYAALYANGSLGPWHTTTSLSSERVNAPLLADGQGHLILTGGSNVATGAQQSDIQYTTITATTGGISRFKTETDQVSATPDGIRRAATVVYGGYVYLLGGITSAGNNRSNVVHFTKLNADGSTGAWTASANTFAGGRMGAAAVAHNGYLYLIGGSTLDNSSGSCPQVGTTFTCKDIQKTSINSSTGDIGAWSSAGAAYSGAGNGRGGLGAAVYNGYVYVIGGSNDTDGVMEQVDIGQIDSSNGNIISWTNNTMAMGGNGRTSFGLAQYGGRIYIVGGFAPGNNAITRTTLTATLGNGGTISVFSDTGKNLAGDRSGNIAGIYNNYLYRIGGRAQVGNGLVGSNDVEYIKINADGTLNGSWTVSPVTFTTSRVENAVAMYNGFMYVMGGCRNTDILGGCGNAPDNLKDVQYAQIHNGGGGITGTWTTNSTSLNTARYEVNSVVSNGYLYVLGGFNDGNRLTSVEYAPLNPDGSLGTFNTTSSVIDAHLTLAGYVAYNGYLYKTGGVTNDTIGNAVQYAAVCTGKNVTTAFSTNCTTSSAPGTLSSWAYTANSANNGTTQSGGFNTARGLHVASAYNGYLYIAGGCSSATGLSNSCNAATASVESAPINADGTIGPWTTVGNFTTARFYLSGMIYNGYLYVVGGCASWNPLGGACGAHASDLQYARVSSGVLAADAGCGSTWCYGPSIEKAGWWSRNALSASNGYMYLLGVENHTPVPANVSYAPIYANGSLGKWQGTSTGYTTNRFSKATLSHNGNLYVIGGCNNNIVGCSGSQMADVQYAGLQSTPQVARHSMLLTTDARTLPANFFTTVTPQSSSSSVDVAVSTANDPAVTLNRLGTNRQITSGTKYQLAPGNDGTKYYWLQITLDDSQSMTWGETAGSNMGYLQLNYHPNPGKRLRGGKTFNQNVIQSLDAP